jgi:hypothetical protein
LTIPHASVDRITDTSTGDVSYLVTPEPDYNGSVNISYKVSGICDDDRGIFIYAKGCISACGAIYTKYRRIINRVNR